MELVKKFGKAGLGLVYTVLVMFAVWIGIYWLTGYVFNLTWTGAAIFWIFGVPVIIGVLQFLASISSIPVVYLMKGSRFFSLVLIFPALYFIIRWAIFLWGIASYIGGLLTWFLAITWFFETAWYFGAYTFLAIGSAYSDQ